MRRFVMLAGVLAVAGCSNFRDLFSAHASVTAEAAGQELGSKRLATIMNAATKGARANREMADFVANVWVDYTLFGQALARGLLPRDSAAIAQVVWPEIAELKGNHWHDSLMKHRVVPGDSAADSAYRSSGIRLLQHILFGVRPNTPAAEKAATRQKAESTLARIKGGASFGRLAAQLSQDPGSRSDSGYLPAGPRGRFVAAFDSAGWSLGPGGVSGLVETPYGYHIIRRPSLAEARPRLLDYLTQRASAHLDSTYMDSLATANKVEVLPDAPNRMRAAAQSPEDNSNPNQPLVRYRGGELTVREYLRWIRALPPQFSTQLKQGNDSMLVNFARILTQNVLLLREADSAHVRLTPAEWDTLQTRYRSQLDTLRAEMGLRGTDVTDSTVPLTDREKLAQFKVEQYFDQLMNRKARLRPLPAGLATMLREKLPYRIHDAGVAAAVELAQEMRQADTASRAALQRAPGPPPIPGQPSTAPGASSSPTRSDSAAVGSTRAPPAKAPAASAPTKAPAAAPAPRSAESKPTSRPDSVTTKTGK